MTQLKTRTIVVSCWRPFTSELTSVLNRYKEVLRNYGAHVTLKEEFACTAVTAVLEEGQFDEYMKSSHAAEIAKLDKHCSDVLFIEKTE